MKREIAVAIESVALDILRDPRKNEVVLLAGIALILLDDVTIDD